MKKSELNQNIKFQNGNFKLGNSEKYNFYIWNISSRITCPYATEMCKKYCYAKYPELIYQSVRDSRQRHLDESKKESFVTDVINHIDYLLNSKKNENKIIIIRLHESGDFYNQEYTNKWITIANNYKGNDKIIFQAYTKSLSYFFDKGISDINIKLRFSIMPDTNNNQIELADNMKLNKFILLKKDEECTGFVCTGICDKCMACYTNEIKDIFVHEHGPNVKSEKNKKTGEVHPFDQINKYRKEKKKKVKFQKKLTRSNGDE